MAGGGCYLVDTCCDGNQTGKQEGVGFTHRAGGRHSYVPPLGLCIVQVTITPQIWNGSSWIGMSGAAKIYSSPLYGRGSMARPCVKNKTFTLTPQTGSGGSTHSCRYKVTDKRYIFYCNFTVQVDAPPGPDFHQSHQTHTP